MRASDPLLSTPLSRCLTHVDAADIDYLVGPYPEATATYKERSPINAVDQFSVPVALFQGLEDKVVPPNQAEEVSKHR